MRRLVIASTLVSLASVVPALAQGAPQEQSAAPRAAAESTAPRATPESGNPQGIPGLAGPNATQDDGAANRLTQSIERSVQTRLALAGFTDIEMVPTSFLVRAKNRDGQTVTLTLAPGPAAEMQQEPSDQADDGAQKGAPSSPPAWRFPGANDGE
jgi:hypothetical protein